MEFSQKCHAKLTKTTPWKSKQKRKNLSIQFLRKIHNTKAKNRLFVFKMTYNASQKHESTLLTSYVYTERIFDSPPFLYNKMFLKELLHKLLAHIFTLLLTPFASKLVNQSRHSESLNIQKNSKLTTRCATNDSPISTQKVPKEA